MAVVGWRETAKGSGVSGRYGESNAYKRAFLIRVDNPATSKVAICRAPGIVYGAAHPDASGCKAMEFDLSMSDDVGLWWTLSVSYYAPPPEQVVTEAGIPADSWAASGGTSTGPAFEDIDGDKIVNSAGDPLEGLEQENDDISWTLTKCYTTLGWDSLRQGCSNTVNSSEWSGGGPGTWKVNFRGAQKKSITQTEPGGVNATPSDGSNAPYDGTETQLEYWETTWEFRYRANGWALRPWDVGFNQIVNGERQAIVGEDGKAVKQPVALQSDGTAKPAGEEPDVIAYDVYQSTNFAIFGDPF